MDDTYTELMTRRSALLREWGRLVELRRTEDPQVKPIDFYGTGPILNSKGALRLAVHDSREPEHHYAFDLIAEAGKPIVVSYAWGVTIESSTLH